MEVVLVHSPSLLAYRFPGAHPLRPERFSLSVQLMEAWGFTDGSHDRGDAALAQPASHPAGRPTARLVAPAPATLDDLLRFHTAEYVAAVRNVNGAGVADLARFGIGPGDTPAFPAMHDAASLTVGGTIAALDAVLSGSATRAHHPAGGLHHAHAGRASGFCVYNDAAVAIDRATSAHPGLRVAYVDIDAHHGDGVEAAFAERSDVLTISVHESGHYLFPGTGRTADVGSGDGEGFSVNVPLLPYSGPESYPLVLEQVISPALERYRPDLIVLQAGADSHRNDPLTHLYNSVVAFDELVAGVVGLSETLCEGRIVALGGGGYDTYSAVPRMWACVLCRLLGVEPPAELPAGWLETARESAERADTPWHPVARTYDEHLPDRPDAGELAAETETTVRRLVERHPLFR